MTGGESARRFDQSDSVIRQKADGSKSTVLMNIVHMAVEAAEQDERDGQVRQISDEAYGAGLMQFDDIYRLEVVTALEHGSRLDFKQIGDTYYLQRRVCPG